MERVENTVKVIEGLRPDDIPDQVLLSTEPLLLKGLVDDWPMVQAAKKSSRAAIDYVRGFYQGATVGIFFAGPESGGRYFYTDDVRGENYQRAMVKLDAVLDRIEANIDAHQPQYVYMGSTTVDNCLPGFRESNDIDLGGRRALASIWLGNQTRIAAHFDVPDNIACCAAGRRSFTLFPPEQVENLYPGPLDFTPGGQVVSMVDFHEPDLERFPRFEEALQSALLAELEPGDAVFVPSMWWHHVEGQEDFNVLINYWWRQSPAFMGTPTDVLDHALLSLRDLPDEQRRAWQELFRYYVFDWDGSQAGHLPAGARGVLDPIDENRARQLRAKLMNKLNR
jgi:hypothetical protein